MLHYKKPTAEQQKADDRVRLLRIRADRIRKNALEFRMFRMRGFVQAWEYAFDKPMPEPNLELEPTAFQIWLGIYVDPQIEWSKTPLELRVEAKQATDRERIRREKIRRWASGSLASEEAYRRRRAAFVMACVPWADRNAIREIYKHCRGLNLIHGKNSYHVDHIIPLQGKKVCGFHVEQNLRVITCHENVTKHNHFTDCN